MLLSRHQVSRHRREYGPVGASRDSSCHDRNVTMRAQYTPALTFAVQSGRGAGRNGETGRRDRGTCGVEYHVAKRPASEAREDCHCEQWTSEESTLVAGGWIAVR